MERWFAAIARAVVRWPSLFLGLAVLYTVATGSLWSRFQIEPDISQMLPEDDPVVQLARAVEQDTANARSLFVLLRGPDLASAIPELVGSLRASPFLVQVDATREELFGESHPHARQAPLHAMSATALQRLASRLAEDGLAAALDAGARAFETDPFGGREIFVADPLGLRWLLDEAIAESMPIPLEPGSPYLVLADGTRAILRLAGRSPPFDVEFSLALLADVEHRLSGIDHSLIGGYAIARADATRIRNDLTSSAFGSILLVSLFLMASLRSLVQPLLVVLPVALSVAWTLPLAGALLGPQTPLSISAAAVLIGLGVDFAIHYLAHFASLYHRQPFAAAIERCHRDLWRPLCAGVLTTVAAFLSLALGHLPGLRTFAILLVIGLLHAFLATLVLLPVLLRAWRHPRAPQQSLLVQACDRVLSSHLRLVPGILMICAAVVGVAATAIFGVQFQTDPSALRPAAENQVREELEQELGFSANAIVLLVPSTKPRQVLADGIAQLSDQGRLKFSSLGGQGTTKQREALLSLQPLLDDFVTATLRQLAARDFDPEPFRPGLERFARLFQATPGTTPPLPERSHDGMTFLEVRCFLPESLHTLARFSDLRTAVHAVLGQDVLVVSAMSLMERLRVALLADLEVAASIAFLLCLLLISLVLRSVSAALLACIPVVIGFAITLGTAALLGIALNPANFIALPLLLGIGVDDGIHYVARCRAGAGDPGEAPNAIWRTTATTALGFGSLYLAESPGLSTLGIMTILGVFTCLFATLLVLPLFTSRATSKSP